MKEKHFEKDTHDKIKEYIEGMNGNEFSLGDLKKSIWGYTYYGGGKFKRKLIEIFHLEEVKDGNSIVLRVKK
jgi:hypothetical protein